MDKELQIIRQALLNEEEAVSFYTLAADRALSAEAREAFLALVAEEQKHIDWLGELYRSLTAGSSPDFTATKYPEPQPPVQYNWETIGRESGSLAVSVFGIGINLEKAAIDFYTAAARQSELAGAKALYEKLARWENQHLEAFQQEYDRLRDQWWEEQGFSPA
jgi:rubrerythrin